MNRFIVADLPDQLALQNDPPLVEVGENVGVIRLAGAVTYQDGQITPIGQQLLGPRRLSVARQDVANSYLQRLGGGSHLLHIILLLALCGACAVGYHRLGHIPLAVAVASRRRDRQASALHLGVGWCRHLRSVGQRIDREVSEQQRGLRFEDLEHRDRQASYLPVRVGGAAHLDEVPP